jgi:hypothetical protein
MGTGWCKPALRSQPGRYGFLVDPYQPDKRQGKYFK